MYIYNLQLYTYVNHQKGLCVSFGPAMQQKGWRIEGPWRWTRLSKYGIQNDQLLSCSSANLRQGLLSPWTLKGFHRVSHAARSVPHRSWSERSSIISKMQSADTSYGISRELEASSPTSRVTVSPHRKVFCGQPQLCVVPWDGLIFDLRFFMFFAVFLKPIVSLHAANASAIALVPVTLALFLRDDVAGIRLQDPYLKKMPVGHGKNMWQISSSTTSWKCFSASFEDFFCTMAWWSMNFDGIDQQKS